ncbi:MAG: hypothetical protein J6V38_01140 [Kiritimatiellae bacterium]|nr:hypothetical protein [Kiritimatiellia bacterium]
MNKRYLISLIAAMVAGAGFGVEWMNVVPDSRVGGRMASCGYLKGKVVLLDVRDYSENAEAAMMKQIQDVWAAYKSKQFVALGSHVGPSGSKEAAGNLIKSLHLTYSIYSDVAVKNDEGALEDLQRGVYVFGSTGKRLYFGKDPRQAMGIVGSAIFAESIPASTAGWKAVLDYEIANLPGQAYLRIRDLKNHKDVLKKLSKEYPDDVKRYAATWREYGENSEVKKLAKLVETTRLIKDRDKNSRASKRLSAATLENLIKQYSVLTQSENSLIAQEAKNSLADLKFVKAELGR